ncbi:hypothetical protein GLV88_00720, partial [Staphylococcus hyicus]|nr:hypothetical protein [Staphylococcus hyicus]
MRLLSRSQSIHIFRRPKYMLNQELKQQLTQLLDLMEGDVVFKLSAG